VSLYFVRWYDPARSTTLKRDFHTKRAAEEFRSHLSLLSEPPKRYSEADSQLAKSLRTKERQHA
jgi:hypothetical protein